MGIIDRSGSVLSQLDGDLNIPIPEWVPFGVRKALGHLGLSLPSSLLEPRSLLHRLIFDVRMKRVWQELLKRKRVGIRPGTDPFYPVRLPDAVKSWTELATAERAYASDARALGDEVEARIHDARAENYEKLPPNIIPGEPSASDEEQLALAGVIFTVIRICTTGIQPIKRSALDARLSELRVSGKETLAREYELQASLPQNERMIVKRQRSAPSRQAFIVQLADYLEMTYGQSMPGIIAILGNVALETRQFSRESVTTVLDRAI